MRNVMKEMPKYEYFLYTWGGFYNEKYKIVHKETEGAKWFDTKEERTSYLNHLRKLEADLDAKHLAVVVSEGYCTREMPTIHRISEYNGVRKYSSYEWSWPEDISVLMYHATWKWYPGFNDYPFGEEFDDYDNVKIVQEWVTGAFDLSDNEE